VHPLTVELSLAALSAQSRLQPDLEDQLSYPNFPSDHPLLTDSLLKFADSLLTLGNPLLILADSQADCPSVSVLNRNSGSLTLMNHFLLVPATGNCLGVSWEEVVSRKSPLPQNFPLDAPKSFGEQLPFVFVARAPDRSRRSLQSSDLASEAGQMSWELLAFGCSESVLTGNCWQSRLQSWLMWFRGRQATVGQIQPEPRGPEGEAPLQLPVGQSFASCSAAMQVFDGSSFPPQAEI